MAEEAPKSKRRIRKESLKAKLDRLLNEYKNILICKVDNVGSNQMQKVRIALRGKAELLMGKNTLWRKVIREHAVNNTQLEALLPLVWGNIGFVFAKGDLGEIKKILVANRVEAPARSGAISPIKVVVPAMNTGLEPTQTAFFQALNIPTKISRGQIEIIQDVTILEEGQKVGASEANLLSKLSIKPFSYGLSLDQVYDNGSVYSHKILDLSEDDLIRKFHSGVRNIAAIGLKIGYPTIASLPHSIAKGYKNVLSVSLATEYTFAKAQKIKDFLANPNAFAAAAPKEAAAAPKGKEAAPKKEEKKKEEPKEEEEDADMGFGLFD